MSENRVLRIAYSVLRFIPIALFLASLALYIRTACPTLGGAFDSEEFQHVAYTLGIAHATGYPLYLLLGKLFTTLVPIGNVAYRMNLLSAVITACAVVMVYLNAMRLTRGYVASLATAILFATNTAVWRQAGVASIGPLHLLLLNAILYALLRWSDARACHFEESRSDDEKSPSQQEISRSARNDNASLSIASFLFGLGLAHHRTTLMFAPAIAIFVLLVDPSVMRRPREIAKNIFWLALPLSLYLYLPLFGNNSPWYSNTWQGFLAQVSGGEAGDFLRLTPPQILDGIVVVAQYLNESFGYLGGVLIIVGAISRIQNSEARSQDTQYATRNMLFLGIATLTYSIWGTLYAGEPDRYLVLPFAFLVHWFAMGVGVVENWIGSQKPGARIQNRISSFILHPSSLNMALIVVLAAFLIFPFPSRFRIADWSTFDRVYKQWDEIFTLPIPNGAALVGNWGQLNAMRYMQRVENRRPDLQFVGTLYDPEPQTQAAQNVLPQGGTLFLVPGIAQPNGDYRYAQLGPLLEVRDKPQTTAPIAQKNIVINSSLALANYEITTALEPYAPIKSIAPTRTARVALTWRANETPKDFIVRVNLYDPDGRLIARKDEAPVRGLYSATQWQRGEYVSDVHNLQIPGGTPPGTYTLKMQTLDAQAKSVTSDEILLDSIVVERATNLTRDQVFIQHLHDTRFDISKYGFELWGYGCEETFHSSDMLNLNLVWHVFYDVGAYKYDQPIRFQLFKLTTEIYDGKTISVEKKIYAWDSVPFLKFYSINQWKKGEILKAYYDLRLPKDLQPGTYYLEFERPGDPLFSVGIGNIQIVP